MATSVSLRRSLRRIPELRLLPGTDLANIMKWMECKHYQPGEVLWRAGNKVDFLAIIQSGEIIVEYRIHNAKIHCARLTAGDYFKPRDLNNNNNRSSVLAFANTDVKLYVLPAKQFLQIKSNWMAFQNIPSSKSVYPQYWRVIFSLFVATLIVLMNRADAVRILTGTFSLRAYQENTSIPDDPQFLRILKYTEVIDPDAVFASNQIGMIWYQSHDLQLSKKAYMRTLDIDQANGPALNNLAVIYFLNGQTLLATLAQKKAVEREPNRALIRYNLGVLLASQNHYRDAIRELKEATYIEPNWVLPYIQCGSIYIKVQDYADAEKEATMAIKLDPQQHAAHLILAIAQYNQNEERDGLKSIENAEQIASHDPVTLFYKALILERLDKSEAALPILRQLLDLTADPREIDRIKTEIDAIHFYMKNGSSRTQ